LPPTGGTMADKRPAFQFYPMDYLSDENVVLMTLEQQGAYMRLMSHCWLEGSIPADLPSLARLCRVPDGDMERIWPGLKKCFKMTGARQTHPRLDLERRKQDAHRLAKSDAGKAGAKAKWQKGEDGTAIVLPMTKDSSSSSISSSITEKKKESGVPSQEDFGLADPPELDALTQEVGRFCARLGCQHWPLKSETVRDWCRRALADTTYAALDLTRLTMEAGERYEVRGEKPEPVRALRGWWNREVKFMAEAEAKAEPRSSLRDPIPWGDGGFLVQG